MKRKIPQDLIESDRSPPAKKQNAWRRSEVAAAFHTDLFEDHTLEKFKADYESSTPYPHAVVSSLIEPNLLRSVRSEITTHITFTPKETDIYRIHQSGDLANLSNLDPESLHLLPSLVKLRDALYSYDFRDWISEVTGAGKLSGRKTDMAVNVYTPGSYLLCHDDVIGSRRVSYILYLTDPDEPWQPHWGGGLRLYPTEKRTKTNCEIVRVPLAEHTVNLPPSFGQLSFFAVRPGESYHDVEEVYHSKRSDEDKARIRMAISGWYHIPQEGEDGFEQGAEEAQAQKSSLAQLEGAADEFDEPVVGFKHFDEPRVVPTSDAKHEEIDPSDVDDTDEDILTEQDLTFLLQYIAPSFLTPDMTERLATSFRKNSVIQLERVLNVKFAARLRSFVKKTEQESLVHQRELDNWRTARPPHKHRYRYLVPPTMKPTSVSPISELLVDLLHSHAFKKWLALITGFRTSDLIKQNAIARRFRRGHDYALASGYRGEVPQIEFTIGITPASGSSEGDQAKSEPLSSKGQYMNGVGSDAAPGRVDPVDGSSIDFGGEEVYMAGDDDDSSVHSKALPQVGKKADPAVYRSTLDDEEDSILVANPASWNTLSVVLRDQGTLRFVKYISQAASGDRWDIKGELIVSPDAFNDEEDEDEDEDDDEDDHENDYDDHSEANDNPDTKETEDENE